MTPKTPVQVSCSPSLLAADGPAVVSACAFHRQLKRARRAFNSGPNFVMNAAVLKRGGETGLPGAFEGTPLWLATGRTEPWQALWPKLVNTHT